ncbi:MAG: ABC transporter permease [Chloroflexi bacterium]|nr:ABC transporter permease [Chloroflexota bacterium]MBI3733261.1 ABC transporter permease [Chloroflexota bacterium]
MVWLDRIKSNYLLRRLVKAIFTVWLVTTLIFFVLRAMPGNPVDIFLQDLTASGISPEEARNQAAALLNIRLDQPIHEQYFEFIGNLLRGDLGRSYRSRGLLVSDMIAARLPWTLFSVGLSLLLSFTIGIALGTIMAYLRDSWFDHLLSNVAATLDALSQYLIGLLAILLLGVVWKAVPIQQMRGSLSPGVQPGFTLEFYGDLLGHVLVLALVYVLSTVGGWTLAMKSSTVATLGEDYVTVAKARGLSDGRIITAYVGRNATLPLFTRLAITIGFALGGAVLLEELFVYQGIGYLLVQAIRARDYPVMQGIFMVITMAVVAANLVADFAYGWLDPRIRIAGEGN